MTTDDDAFERLRAADPAAGTEPDLARIHTAVAAATGVTPAGGRAGDDEATAHDELAARRRPRTEWLRMAAAVAAVAVVGTGGYVAASLSGGSTTTAGTALPAISLNQSNGGREPAGSGDALAPAPQAAGASASSGVASVGMSDMAVMPVYGGHLVFAGQGLSTETGSATAWALDASSVASADTAARVAAALGVTGTPQVQWGAWVVGPNDGSGPTVTLDGSGNLSFYDPRRDPWQCQGSSGAGVSGSSAVGGEIAVQPVAPSTSAAPGATVAPAEQAPVPAKSPSQPGPADPSVCTLGSTPTGDAAISRARDALTAVGVDTSGTQVQVDDSNAKGADSTGAAYVYVSFQQVIDGRLTGVGWSVALVGDGVQNLSGTLAPLVSLGSYPVISPAAAVDRLNDPRFGASGGVVYPLDGKAYAADGAVASTPGAVATADPSQPPVTPPAAQPGAAIGWPVQHVTLVSAQLGVALTYQSGGAQLLVPAYVLTDTTGATWSVIAVADDHLDFGTE